MTGPQECNPKVIIEDRHFWRFSDRIFHETDRFLLLTHLESNPPECIDEQRMRDLLLKLSAETEGFLQTCRISFVIDKQHCQVVRCQDVVRIDSQGGLIRAHGQIELERRFGRWGRRLHELSMGIDEHPVESERPTLQVSAEDTFERDVLLRETEETLRRLAVKVWAGVEKEIDRTGRTVVLKLKTADFRIITRSLTPASPPSSLAEFLDIALSLYERVDLPSRTRYRLIGVGLGNFRRSDELPPQPELFG